jgi:hypothetical protein
MIGAGQVHFGGFGHAGRGGGVEQVCLCQQLADKF